MALEFRPTIGLEIHAELKTQTKMFCNSLNAPEEIEPNVNICPICLAHPGTLPVINRAAVLHVLRVGAALNGTFTDYSEFDRKSYFYPDIPKGYQISQFAHPLVSGGKLADVSITRIHLEEDTARSIHSQNGSLIDFNRAGIPLMELVTEPVIHDAETAGKFARQLQLILRTLDASDANLDKGEMRIEANISVSTEKEALGTKVEIKNLNSFRSLERAIDFEINRHTNLIQAGQTVVQETRGWDETKQVSFSQRLKEVSADYRYFPEPDLPKLFLSQEIDFTHDVVHASLPELPWERRMRYMDDFSLNEISIAYLIADPARSHFFDAVVEALNHEKSSVQLATNYIVSDLAGLYAKEGNSSISVDPLMFARLVLLTASRKLSSRGAKDVLEILVASGGDPESIAKEKGFFQSHDPTFLADSIEKVLSNESKAVQEYRLGKTATLKYLLGKAMKETAGSGNPEELEKMLVKRLQDPV